MTSPVVDMTGEGTAQARVMGVGALAVTSTKWANI